MGKCYTEDLPGRVSCYKWQAMKANFGFLKSKKVGNWRGRPWCSSGLTRYQICASFSRACIDMHNFASCTVPYRNAISYVTVLLYEY